ncbi:FliM/FliN family flagellar motor switch protein [Burkholderia sp. 22PA0099]|uniref:FliM/FliN family flagellar motor switch protein n=1 Tax=Burkholderia sp. 22PA0099 TaxID=3237372 RepID=UPI0039C45873
MSTNPELDVDAMLADLGDHSAGLSPDPAAALAPRRASPGLLRKISVRLTLEVGGATLPLSELAALGPGSIVDLDRLAGEPLVMKVNGEAIGTAEVVVAGEHYGLRIVSLDDLTALAR